MDSKVINLIKSISEINKTDIDICLKQIKVQGLNPETKKHSRLNGRVMKKFIDLWHQIQIEKKNL